MREFPAMRISYSLFWRVSWHANILLSVLASFLTCEYLTLCFGEFPDMRISYSLFWRVSWHANILLSILASFLTCEYLTLCFGEFPDMRISYSLFWRVSWHANILLSILASFLTCEYLTLYFGEFPDMRISYSLFWRVSWHANIVLSILASFLTCEYLTLYFGEFPDMRISYSIFWRVSWHANILLSVLPPPTVLDCVSNSMRMKHISVKLKRILSIRLRNYQLNVIDTTAISSLAKEMTCSMDGLSWLYRECPVYTDDKYIGICGKTGATIGRKREYHHQEKKSLSLQIITKNHCARDSRSTGERLN